MCSIKKKSKSNLTCEAFSNYTLDPWKFFIRANIYLDVLLRIEKQIINEVILFPLSKNKEKELKNILPEGLSYEEVELMKKQY